MNRAVPAQVGSVEMYDQAIRPGVTPDCRWGSAIIPTAFQRGDMNSSHYSNTHLPRLSNRSEVSGEDLLSCFVVDSVC